MCTPLMAQRWLLHHAALATGFACSPCWSAAPAARELTGEEWDELIALGIAKDNGGDVFNALVRAYAPALHLRGNTLISGCWEELRWSCKKTLVTVSVWSEAFFQDRLAHMKINTATLFLWQPERLCAGMLLRWVPGQTDIPGISVKTVLHSCTKKSQPLSHYSNDLILTSARFADRLRLAIVSERWGVLST